MVFNTTSNDRHCRLSSTDHRPMLRWWALSYHQQNVHRYPSPFPPPSTHFEALGSDRQTLSDSEVNGNSLFVPKLFATQQPRASAMSSYQYSLPTRLDSKYSTSGHHRRTEYSIVTRVLILLYLISTLLMSIIIVTKPSVFRTECTLGNCLCSTMLVSLAIPMTAVVLCGQWWARVVYIMVSQTTMWVIQSLRSIDWHHYMLSSFSGTRHRKHPRSPSTRPSFVHILMVTLAISSTLVSCAQVSSNQQDPAVPSMDDIVATISTSTTTTPTSQLPPSPVARLPQPVNDNQQGEDKLVKASSPPFSFNKITNSYLENEHGKLRR